ncbi:MAG: dihydrodipicolinate synthase family protein [Chloroflexaceae bacterium]|nr:dihydrodipicolinate synthase family protein [Chloroflexaceae bacterium]
MIDVSGIYPPIPTPFYADEQLAHQHLEANVQRWLTQPLDGIVTPGSNSEAAYLTFEERVTIWRICGDMLRSTGKHLIAGTGAETTAETIRLTQHAAEAGAIAALVITPSFFRAGMTPAALVAHFHTVADESPIPVLVYNVPAFTSIDLAPQTILDMAAHRNIIGMKDSSANVTKVAQVLAEQPDFQVLSGSGTTLLPF